MKTSLKNILFFLLPAVILLLLFLVLPIFASFYMSFNKIGLAEIINWKNMRFIGIENYKNIIFHDEIFRKAVVNTLKVLVVAMPLTIGLSLGLAVLINNKLVKFKSFFRVGFYLPAITNTVAVAVVWKWILNGNYGLLDYMLKFLGIEGPNWLSDPNYAIYAIIMLVVWKAIGPNTIIFLAGLQSVPEAVLEAADIDGATGFKKFTNVIIPIISPTIMYVSLMILIGYMQLFDEPYMLTNGGPINSTISIVMLIYNQGFVHFNFGYASALSFVLFVGIFLFSILRLKLSKKED